MPIQRDNRLRPVSLALCYRYYVADTLAQQELLEKAGAKQGTTVR